MIHLPLVFLWVMLGSTFSAAAGEVSRTYEVSQSVVLRDVPKHARQARLWISIPDEDPAQRVLDLRVRSAPGKWRLVREADHGNQFLLVEADTRGSNSLTTTIDFTVQRSSVFFDLDQAKAGSITESQRGLFADELRQDAPHMEVTEQIQKIADEVCGTETNLVVQARKLIEYVAENADHYSKDSSKPNCGIGAAKDCLVNGGGCCTDLHSLFIALARARGIPARLQMGYRLQAKNLGVEADPGYRCWPEFFVPRYGWVPTDIVEADAASNEEERSQWMSGLSERRIHLNQGRNFRLESQKAKEPVNTMIIGYAEIDGVPARVLPEGDKRPQLARTVRFTEVADSRGAEK